MHAAGPQAEQQDDSDTAARQDGIMVIHGFIIYHTGQAVDADCYLDGSGSYSRGRFVMQLVRCLIVASFRIGVGSEEEMGRAVASKVARRLDGYAFPRLPRRVIAIRLY